MDNEEALAELVLECAEGLAAGVLNAGEGLEFLITNGWKRSEVVARLQEMVGEPESVEEFLRR